MIVNGVDEIRVMETLLGSAWYFFVPYEMIAIIRREGFIAIFSFFFWVSVSKPKPASVEYRYRPISSCNIRRASEIWWAPFVKGNCGILKSTISPLHTQWVSSVGKDEQCPQRATELGETQESKRLVSVVCNQESRWDDFSLKKAFQKPP